MNWVFITPLAIALVVAFLFKNATDEIAYLAGSLVLVSLLVSLIVAPWQIKLVLLVLVILASRHWLQTPKDSWLETSDEKKSELSYRGAKYSAASSEMLVNEGAVAGKYRGGSWRTHTPKDAVATSNNVILYRGAKVSHEVTDRTAVQKDVSLEQG